MTHGVIDIHHHIFPASSAVHPWNIETDKAVMDRQGITRVLLSMPLVTDTATAHGYNLLLQQQVQAYPEQYAMMGVLPYDDADAALREIEFVMDELKAPAFGLNTHNHEIYISDDSLNPVFEELNRRNAVIFLHPNHRRASRNQKMLFCGNDSVYEYPFDTTRAVVDFVLQDKVTRWPNIRWILPHAGGTIPFLAHRISVSGRWGSIQQSEEEILRVFKSFYYDLTLNNTDLNYRFLKDFAGADHLLFGTDYPPCPEDLLADDLKAMDRTGAFTPAEKERILFRNAEALLGLSL